MFTSELIHREKEREIITEESTKEGEVLILRFPKLRVVRWNFNLKQNKQTKIKYNHIVM